MKLHDLFDTIQVPGKALRGDLGKDPDLSRLAYDSRKVRPEVGGTIFACARGEHVDGHDYAAQAVAAGASALLCERPMPLGVPQIVVPNVRRAMGEVTAALYGYPARTMTMIGLTGTNGKTTTAYITRSIMRAAGHVTGMLGTIVYDDGVTETDADRTTPEGPDVQEMLARMAGNGATACVMEASSHGLDQGRLAGCRFDCAGFSNLTPEHQEYHKDMENYYEAKRLLFADYTKSGWRGAVNADDEYGRRLLAEFPQNAAGFSLEETQGRDASAALYRAADVSVSTAGTSLVLVYPDGERTPLNSPQIGRYNAANVLESVVIADAMGVDRAAIKRGVEGCPQVPGRLERYALTNGATVFVDFAHSSDGVEKVLTTLRPLTRGRLHILWGAGGDRTPTKRPEVGRIMAEHADVVTITSDNPRSEEPEAIARDVERGVLAGPKVPYRTIIDRREAIYAALDAAAPGDILVIAGKGPERFIEYATHKVPFCDAQVVMDWARERGIGVTGR